MIKAEIDKPVQFKIMYYRSSNISLIFGSIRMHNFSFILHSAFISLVVITLILFHYKLMSTYERDELTGKFS